MQVSRWGAGNVLVLKSAAPVTRAIDGIAEGAYA